MADRDGVDAAAPPNGRLLVGMQGSGSAGARPPWRGRGSAGVQHKAQRGALALAFPAGLLRPEAGSVVTAPDRAVPHARTVGFQTFLERRAARPVVRLWRDQGLRRPRRSRTEETVWRPPTVAAVMALVRPPASAGPVGYGTTRLQGQPGSGRSQPRRRPLAAWKVSVPDRDPAYVTWEPLARLQAILDDHSAVEAPNPRRGGPRQGAALRQGIGDCGSCGPQRAVQDKGGKQSLCHALRSQAHAPVCPRLPAAPVAPQGVAAVCDAVAPAELARSAQAFAQRQQPQAALDRAPRSRVQRLADAADQARRRDAPGAPAYRLVAAALERRWAAAVQACPEAQAHDARRRPTPADAMAMTLPPALREALRTLGHALPTLWHQATVRRAPRTALLRCRREQVGLERRTPETLTTRMVWRGGAVRELEVPCTVGTLRDFTGFGQMEAPVWRLEAQGPADEDRAQRRTAPGFRSPQRPRGLARTVQTIRLRHGRLHRYRGPRPRRVPRSLTVAQMATAVGGKPHGVDHVIRRGRLVVRREEARGRSRFPDGSATRAAFRQLRDGHRRALRACRKPPASRGSPAGPRRRPVASPPGPAAFEASACQGQHGMRQQANERRRQRTRRVAS